MEAPAAWPGANAETTIMQQQSQAGIMAVAAGYRLARALQRAARLSIRQCLLLGLAAAVALSVPAPASASIFGDAGRFVKKTTKKVGRAAGSAVKDVGRATGKAAKVTGKAVGNAAGSVGKVAAKTTGTVAKTAVKTAGKVAKGVGSAVVGAAMAVEPLGVAIGKPFVTPAKPRPGTQADRWSPAPSRYKDWRDVPVQPSSAFMRDKR
jgi:hypothetical protein